MPRKAEPGISYYRMNCGHTSNRKVRLLFNEFGSDGYWIWQCILDEAYHYRGYYFDCSNQDSLELFATDVCKKQVAVVEEVILGSVRRGLFDKSVFDQFRILSSVMMQEFYLEATKERRRKGSVIELKEDLLLIEINQSEPGIHIVPGKKAIPPRRNEQIPGRNAQSKVKERKEKESISAPAEPAREKKGRSKVEKTEEPPEPHWQQLVDVWFKFVEEKFGEPPLFQDKDPRHFKSVIGKLKKRAAGKNIEWTQENAVFRLKMFLDFAFSDPWLATHFLLKHLDEKFEGIGRDVKRINEQVKNQPAVDPAADIQQLYESFKNGKPNISLITEQHYELLESKNYIHQRPDHFTAAVRKRMDNLTGSNQARELRLLQLYEKDVKLAVQSDPDFALLLKRMVVMEFFYQLETHNVKTVFHANKAAV